MEGNGKKSDEEVYRERDDLEMMRRRRLWPGPTLCLKNPTLKSAGGWPSFGMLYIEEGKYVFQFRDEAEPGTRRGGDEMLVALVEEGWIVD